MEPRGAEDAGAQPAACEFLTTVGGRLRGLLGRAPDKAWHMLAPCSDVHTFAMGRELDIAFLDREGVVLLARRRVGANRRVRCRAAAAAVERFASDEPWLLPGDRVSLAIGLRDEEEELQDARKEER